jgi:hypothetical protein
MATWPCTQGDCSASCVMSSRVITRPQTHNWLLCHHMSPDPWLTLVSPSVPTSVVDFLISAPCGVDSYATMCHRTRGQLPSLHLAGWATVPPCVPRPVAGFLLCALLWGGLLCHQVYPYSRLAPVPPHVPKPVAGFFLSAACEVDPLPPGVPRPTTGSRTATIPDPWLASLSLPPCGWALV